MANVRAVAQPLTVESRALAQQYDRVIEDFIDYDLGQLRGRAGWAARDRLMALGPDAVPALVRGLNRSAAIHASCPVGVLAGKLMQVLRESGDPTWKQFAVDHLGEGVPHNAPHFRRIIALRDRWLGGSASSMAAASRLVDSAGVAESGQVMELALALGDAPAETLLVYLEGDDSILQSAAMVALVQNPTAYPPRVRGRLLLVLNRLANTAADKSTRVLARRAVKSLPAAS